MSEKSFKLKIVSPDRKLFEDTVEYVNLDTTDGERAVMKSVAPFVAELVQGVIDIKQDGRSMQAFNDEGFAIADGNGVTVMTKFCCWPNETDIVKQDDRADSARAERDYRLFKADLAVAMRNLRDSRKK